MLGSQCFNGENMDNAAAYLIMILSPVFWLIMKLSVQYAMVYENPKKKMSRSFLRKNSGGGAYLQIPRCRMIAHHGSRSRKRES